MVSVSKGFQWLFKRKEQDLIELFTFFIGLLAVSILSVSANLRAIQWYWVIPLLLFGVIIYRMFEDTLRYFFHKRNRRVSGGYFVLVMIVMALINTYILY